MTEPEKRGRGRPRLADPRNPRTHRFADSTYLRALEIAKDRGDDLTEVLERSLRNYVRQKRRSE
jgi:hypothetical protein